jgi:cyclopropane fatty-acyl-phospholipid synthase-like methyltransferase
MGEPFNALTDEAFWTNRFKPELTLSFEGAPPLWYDAVAEFLPQQPGATCIEIGVVPGGMLFFFAKERGYRCTGVDFSPVIEDVGRAFSRHGMSADWVQTDFLTWETDRRFDLVYSCGFVEHFKDFGLVIERHWRLVKPGGTLLITVPAMTPAQHLLRRIFYTREKFAEVKASHNFSIMGLDALVDSVRLLSAAEILMAEYTSGFEIWFGAGDPGVRRFLAPLLWPFLQLQRLARKVGRSSRWYSPNVIVVARKQDVHE